MVAPKKNNNQKPNHNIPRFFLIEIKKAFVVDTVTTVFGKIFHIANTLLKTVP